MGSATTQALLWPGTTIDVSADRLEARMVFSGHTEQPARPIGRDQVLDRIAGAGIVHGIDNAAIDQSADALTTGAHLPEPLVVARGLPPASAQLGSPELLVAAITDPQTAERLRLTAPLHYQDMVHIVGKPEPARVDPELVLLRLGRTTDARPGVAVDGEPLEPGPPGLPLVLGPGVRFDPDNLAVTSELCGIVLYDGNSVAVLPLAYDARVEVSIAPDGMSCSVSLVANGPNGLPLTAETVRPDLMAAGVRLGVIPAEVEAAVADAHRDGRATREVARGRLPQNGADAGLEYFVNLDPVTVPLAEEHGRVDFRSISVIRSVSAGQPLVRRHPATKGVPGFSVTGQRLSARHGREVGLPRGRNTMLDPNDPNLLRATIDGNVRASGGHVEVSECFVVKGDVDYSTGHIKYERSVMVKGDIKGGFNLEVGGDLEVAGLAEDSIIKVGGTVLIRRGFVGQGHGLIEAGGRVLLGFGRNQRIRCSGTLTIEREAVNMNLSSRDAVVVAGLLVGGRITAGSRISCRVLGNASGTRTDLEVGLPDQSLLEQRAQTAERIRQLRHLLAAGPSPPQPGVVGPDLPRVQQPLSAEEIVTRIDSLEDQLKAIQTQVQIVEGARVVVQDTVWPGTQVKIRNSPVLKVTDRLPGPLTFALRDGEVRWA
ncbi:MAG: FapA family protein [Bacillota bacterium]|nr:FapA family protein [Bacillota bacterium]